MINKFDSLAIAVDPVDSEDGKKLSLKKGIKSKNLSNNKLLYRNCPIKWTKNADNEEIVDSN